MKKLLVVCMFAALVLGLSNSYTSADEEKPKVEDTTQYDLTPTYLKDMKWKETIVTLFTDGSSSSKKTDKFTMSAEVTVTELKDKKPIKLKYKDFGGKRESSYEDFDVEDRNRTKEVEIEKEDKDFELDSDLRFTAVKIRKLYDFEFMYPSGNILGFARTTKAVKVGDEWKSTNLIPLNFHLFGEMAKEAGLEIKDIESKFKLKEVKKTEVSSTAIITWTGKFTMPIMKSSMEFKWSGEISFDILKKRTIEVKCVTESEFDGKKLKYDVSRKLEYDVKPETKKEEPEVEPKDAEDE